MRTIIIFLIFAGFFADSFADPIYDTTKVAGWQVLVPETEPAGWNIPFNMADSSWLEVSLSNEPSPFDKVSPSYQNNHSIKFACGQTNGLFWNEYYFFKQLDTTVELQPEFGEVRLYFEYKLTLQSGAHPEIKIGFVKGGTLFMSPVWLTNIDHQWHYVTWGPIQDENGGNPPQNFNGMVEVDNLVIYVSRLGYNLEAHILIDNISSQGKNLIDPMGDILTSIDSTTSTIPDNFELKQNYPNPFNPATAIKYQLPTTEDVKLDIYNVLGQKVRTLLNRKVKAGYHKVIWDGRIEFGIKAPSGLYFYRIRAGDFVKTRKMILMK